MTAGRNDRRAAVSRRRIGAVTYILGTGFFVAALLATLWASIQLQPYTRVFGR